MCVWRTGGGGGGRGEGLRVYISFLISAQNIDRGYSLEPPHTHNPCFEQKYEKYQNFYLTIFIFGGKIFTIFELACFRNGRQIC